VRLRERRRDLDSGREHACDRCREGGGLDGMTMRRVLISQNVLPFVSCTCLPATPIDEMAKGVPLTFVGFGNVG
jgi:hypothetical protein